MVIYVFQKMFAHLAYQVTYNSTLVRLNFFCCLWMAPKKVTYFRSSTVSICQVPEIIHTYQHFDFKNSKNLTQTYVFSSVSYLGQIQTTDYTYYKVLLRRFTLFADIKIIEIYISKCTHMHDNKIFLGEVRNVQAV